MSTLKDRLMRLTEDPRFIELLKNPRVQKGVVEAFRWLGRAQGAVDQRLDRWAGRLNLATQKDLRALHRRIRHLERELRETEERLNESEAARGAPDHS